MTTTDILLMLMLQLQCVILALGFYYLGKNNSSTQNIRPQGYYPIGAGARAGGYYPIIPGGYNPIGAVGYYPIGTGTYYPIRPGGYNPTERIEVNIPLDDDEGIPIEKAHDAAKKIQKAWKKHHINNDWENVIKKNPHLANMFM